MQGSANAHSCCSRQACKAEETPTAPGAAPGAPATAKTPWRTPPPVFDEAETPAAAAGWQELCGGDGEGAPRFVQLAILRWAGHMMLRRPGDQASNLSRCATKHVCSRQDEDTGAAPHALLI